MGKYCIWDQQGLNYLTLTIVGWIDIFSRQRYRDIVVDSLLFCQKHKGLHIVGWVIMSNHLHMIAYTDKLDLSDVLRDFKKFTANKIIASIQQEPESRREWLLYLFKHYGTHNTNNHHYQIWQQDNHPIALWSLPVMWQKLNYTHLNPVRAGIVKDQTQYVYSSAADYWLNTEGLLKLDFLEPIGPVLPNGYF